MKAPPRLLEEFQVFGNGHDILVALPLSAHLEVTEDLARDVGFERPLYQGTETLLGILKIGVLRGDIEKPETLELPEEPLVSTQMRNEMGRCFKAGIHVAQGDHRRSTRERRRKKQGKLVDEIAEGGIAIKPALVNLGRQRVLGDPQFVTKEMDLVLLRFEVVQILVGQNEVQKDEPGTHEIERVPFTVPQVVLVDLPVDGAGKQMKDGAPAHVIPDRSVTPLEDFLRERCGPLSVRSTSEGAELPQREVARVDRNEIEKTGLRFGVAEFLDPFDVVRGKVHSDKISAVNSR